MANGREKNYFVVGLIMVFWFMISFITNIIGPLIVGWLGDMLGLRTGMLFICLTVGYIFSIGCWAKPLVANKTVSLKKEKKNV